MTEFNVGDRVMVNTKTWHYSGKNADTEYPATVTRVNRPGEGHVFGYQITFDGDQGISQANGHQLTPLVQAATAGAGGIQGAVDNVNHPPHYKKYPVKVIEITEQLDFNKGNAVKYILRAGHKAGVDELEDLSKSAWYIARAIEKLKKERETNG
jgi:hypothetical protein